MNGDDPHGDGKQPKPDHAREFEFMVAERRNLLAGLWAAELLGLIGQAAHDYARRLMRHDPDHEGGDRFVEALHEDLGDRTSRGEIRSHMRHLMDVARRQIRAERRR